MNAAPTTRPSLLIRLRDPADGQAWAEFVEIYGPLVWRLARRRGFQHADVEDLVQDVFRVVTAAIERGVYDSARGSFRGWLFRIARNLAVNALRERSRQPRATGDSAVADLLGEQPVPGDAAQFETEYRRRLLEWAAERVRDEFSDAAWRAFWATGVEGRPAAQVAESLRLGVGSVYNAKSRVMARLRKEVERVLGGDATVPDSEGG